MVIWKYILSQICSRGTGLEIRRESILTMILVASKYENQFLSFNYVVSTTVTQNFDSPKILPLEALFESTLPQGHIFYLSGAVWISNIILSIYDIEYSSRLLMVHEQLLLDRNVKMTQKQG